jgi:hypothetical protein
VNIVGFKVIGQLADDFETYDVHGMLRQLGVAKPLTKEVAA